MKILRVLPSLIALVSLFALWTPIRGAMTYTPPDSLICTDTAVCSEPDTVRTLVPESLRASSWNPPVYTDRKDSPDWWLNRIKSHTYDIKDTTVIYPGFTGFCVKVYNWGDSFFNTYDPRYVVGTGTKWKAMVKVSNWTDSYIMTMGKTDIHMLSNVYSNVGPYVSFMAVSVGYEANLNRLISHLPARQKRWTFSFTTSLFRAEIYYNTNKDGTVIRRFGEYRNDKGRRLIKMDFPGLQLRNFGLDLIYFFNHKRYSHGAAYDFSKYQKRSQGSLLLGIALSHQYINIDFRQLPQALLAYYPKGIKKEYNFTYNDYCLMLGYGYNWVLGKHWLWNITALPNMGLKHCMPQTVGGSRELFSFNAKGTTSFVFNSGAIFAGAFFGVDMHWYDSSRTNFVNAVITFGAQGGYRF